MDSIFLCFWVFSTPVVSLVFGSYLYLCINWLHIHFDEAFSSLRIAKTNKKREAIGKALVYCYPLAGRLWERPNGKLLVECTREGVLCTGANACVTLDHFGGALQPPFPGWEDLIYNVPGSSDIINSPLMLIQATHLACGGFIFALRLNHTMCDAVGLVQFLTIISEMTRGKNGPSVEPVWNRDLLNAHNQPCITCIHREYDHVPDINRTLNFHEDMTSRSFFFCPQDITVLRRQLPPHLHNSCTLRLQLPIGYYGNVVAIPVALYPVGKLCEKPLGYALDLVKKDKAQVTEKTLSDQFEAKKAKNKAKREREHAMREERLAQGPVERAPPAVPAATEPTPQPAKLRNLKNDL